MGGPEGENGMKTTEKKNPGWVTEDPGCSSFEGHEWHDANLQDEDAPVKGEVRIDLEECSWCGCLRETRIGDDFRKERFYPLGDY